MEHEPRNPADTSFEIDAEPGHEVDQEAATEQSGREYAADKKEESEESLFSTGG